jgi:formylmethanofuran dehydrogenase subunit D
VVTAARKLRNGDTISVEGDQLVVFHFCEEYGQVVVDAVSQVSARRYELHYMPDARVSVL